MRSDLVCVCFIVIGLLFTGMSHAEIDPGSAVGVWLFDEGEDDTAKDSSGRGHNGKLVGGPKWVNGKFGGGLDFDGVDDKIEVPYSADFDLDDLTIMAWINISEQTGGWQQIMMKQGAGSPQTDRNFMIEVHTTSGRLRGTISSGNQTTDIIGQTVLWDGEWHHLAMTYDMESLKIYVDGVLEGEKATKAEPNKKQVIVTIGSLPDRNFTRGIIDEAAIFNVALDEDDINDIMNKGLEKALALTAVSPAGKLNSVWGSIKAQYDR